MERNRIILICVAILAFLVFSVVQYKNSRCYTVLSIKTPLEIVVDLNKNGIEDDNEVIKILEGYEYIDRTNVSTQKLGSKYNMSESDLIGLAYLTEKYVNEFLKDKVVTIKGKDNDKTICVGVQNFNEKFLKTGYLFKDGKPVNPKELSKTLKYISKSNLVVYNAKSNKYHKLDCKYGLMTFNYVCVPRSQLPKGAKCCKYCFPHKHKHKHKHHNKNKDKIDYKELSKPIYVKPVPFSITNGAVKILVTDCSTKFKPDRNGNTELCRELVNRINSAKTSIDIAIYGYDRVPKIETAIKNAIARGVVVRLVHDVDSKNGNIYADTMSFASLIKNVSTDKAPVGLEKPSSYMNSIMHDKFFIFDDSVVVTGSANLSYTDMSGFNSNNVVIISSSEVARIYKQEFEQMYNSKFHNLKQPINKESIVLGDTKLSVYFSPYDRIIERVVVPIIDNAKSQIYIPAFLITDKRLAQSLINAKTRGVDVKVIIDATNAKSPYSKHPLLRQHGIPVKTETFAGKLHSKTIIVDNKYSIIGSMNFSRSGETKNDENVLVIVNPKLAMFNRMFFEYLWKKIDNYWLTHDANAEGLDSPGSCSDGIDNDYDGKIDMEDEGCRIFRGRYVR